jgi:hypothetical protein
MCAIEWKTRRAHSARICLADPARRQADVVLRIAGRHNAMNALAAAAAASGRVPVATIARGLAAFAGAGRLVKNMLPHWRDPARRHVQRESRPVRAPSTLTRRDRQASRACGGDGEVGEKPVRRSTAGRRARSCQAAKVDKLLTFGPEAGGRALRSGAAEAFDGLALLVERAAAGPDHAARQGLALCAARSRVVRALHHRTQSGRDRQGGALMLLWLAQVLATDIRAFNVFATSRSRGPATMTAGHHDRLGRGDLAARRNGGNRRPHRT